MNDFWDKKTSEYEMLQDNMEDSAQEILDELEEEENEEEYEEEYEEEDDMSDYQPTKNKVAYKLNKRENDVVNDAMVRLEQARLYDMLIKHDMFKGVKANPRALANVQAELKAYIVQRLEILLGIKKDQRDQVEKQVPKEVQVELPFNDIEIEFLKALSYKGTKGASAQAESKKVMAREVLPTIGSRPAPIQSEPEGLQSLGSSYDDEDEYEEEYQEPKRKLKKKAAPVKKVANASAPKKPSQAKPKPSRAKLSRGGQITDEEAERIAREDIERMKGRKPVNQMSAEDLMRANSGINSGRTARPEGAKPIPTGASLKTHYMTKQMNQSTDPKSDGFNVLLNKILADKK